jgi:hypothetical protein
MQLEAGHPRFTIVVTGGTLRPKQHSLVEPLATGLFESLRVDTVFLGCNGVSVDGGVTNINLPEAYVKRAMIEAAARCVVLADSTKLGVRTLAPVCSLDDVDVLVTDGRATVGDLDVDPCRRRRRRRRRVGAPSGATRRSPTGHVTRALRQRAPAQRHQIARVPDPADPSPRVVGRGRQAGDGHTVTSDDKEHNVHKRKMAAAAVAVSLVVAACGGDDEDDTTADTAADTEADTAADDATDTVT